VQGAKNKAGYRKRGPKPKQERKLEKQELLAQKARLQLFLDRQKELATSTN